MRWLRRWAGRAATGPPRGTSRKGRGGIAVPQEEHADVIDRLVGIEPSSALDAVRRRRPVAREQAQASYRALFAPGTPGGVTATERFAVAAFVAGMHGEMEVAAFYAAGLAASGASAELRGAIDA